MKFDDMGKQIMLQLQPNGTTYIDECNGLGLDFTTEQTLKHYILQAVVEKISQV